jgi:hypothetical protein
MIVDLLIEAAILLKSRKSKKGRKTHNLFKNIISFS